MEAADKPDSVGVEESGYSMTRVESISPDTASKTLATRGQRWDRK